MKLIILLSLGLVWSTISNAQKTNTFSLQINYRVVLKTQSIPQNEALKINIARQSLLKKCLFTLKINELDPNSKWHRVIIVSNEQGQEISRKVFTTTNGTFSISLKLPNDVKIIKLATLTEPNDPNEAALMRLRTFPIADITLL